MITTHGRVVAIRDGSAVVSLPVPAGCGKCGSRGACDGAKERTVSLPAGGLAAGDEVTLATTPGALNRGVLLAYLMPAVCFIAGAVGGQLGYGSDEAAVIGAALGLGAGLLLLRLFGRRGGCIEEFHSHHGASHERPHL